MSPAPISLARAPVYIFMRGRSARKPLSASGESGLFLFQSRDIMVKRIRSLVVGAHLKVLAAGGGEVYAAEEIKFYVIFNHGFLS